MWLYHRVMSPNNADGMANSVDPDQTAPPLGAVWSGSTLFAQAYLSENFGSLRYMLDFSSLVNSLQQDCLENSWAERVMWSCALPVFGASSDQSCLSDRNVHSSNQAVRTLLCVMIFLKSMSHTTTNQQNDLCTQQRLRSAWASAQSDQSSLCAHWVAKVPMLLHANSEDQYLIEDSDQTGQMPRLIWVFAAILLVLSCCGS